MTAGENPDYWEYGFEVFNVFCWGQKTDLQVRVFLLFHILPYQQIIVSTLEHEEGAGHAFAASVISRFDLDIVRHAIYGDHYIHRLFTETGVNHI